MKRVGDGEGHHQGDDRDDEPVAQLVEVLDDAELLVARPRAAQPASPRMGTRGREVPRSGVRSSGRGGASPGTTTPSRTSSSSGAGHRRRGAPPARGPAGRLLAAAGRGPARLLVVQDRALELPDAAPDRRPISGRRFGPEHEQRDDQDDQDLDRGEVEHGDLVGGMCPQVSPGRAMRPDRGGGAC